MTSFDLGSLSRKTWLCVKGLRENCKNWLNFKYKYLKYNAGYVWKRQEFYVTRCCTQEKPTHSSMMLQDYAISEIALPQFFSIVQHHSGISSFQFWYLCELPFIVKLWTFFNVTFDFYFSTLYRRTFHLNLFFFILNQHYSFWIESFCFYGGMSWVAETPSSPGQLLPSVHID